MTRRTRDMIDEDEGGAAVEVALVMPVLLLILIGTMQFGVVLFGYCSASFAARNAARFASLHSSASLVPATTASVQASVTPYLWMGNQVGTPTVTPTWSSGNTVGNPVKVSVSVTYKVVLPFTSWKQMTLTAVAARTIVR